MKLNEYEKIETGSIDFKLEVERKKSKSWLKTVSAFANGTGGILLFGVDDNKNLIGLKNLKSDSEFITSSINGKIDPLPRYELKKIEQYM